MTDEQLIRQSFRMAAINSLALASHTDKNQIREQVNQALDDYDVKVHNVFYYQIIVSANLELMKHD